MSNGGPPESPGRPPQRDVANLTAVNRMSLKSWALQVAIKPTHTAINYSTFGFALGKNNAPPSEDLEEMNDIHIRHEVSVQLTEMSQAFQDAVTLIQTDLENYTLINEFPEEE